MNPSRSQKFRNRGAGALEFALSAPLLLGLLLATVDLGRYLVSAQLAAASATAVADLASQTDTFTPEMDPDAVTTGQEVAVLAQAAAEVARPVDLTTDGAIIVTVMTNRGNGPEIAWTRRWGRSDIRTTVSATSLRGVPIPAGDSAVFAEVAGTFRPWLLSGRLLGLDEAFEYRSVSVRRPRLGGPTVSA
ncbi:MAG: TadE/TadG family type IV pilus assembly protein [Sandaracinobacteroides sp.]